MENGRVPNPNHNAFEDERIEFRYFLGPTFCPWKPKAVRKSQTIFNSLVKSFGKTSKRRDSSLIDFNNETNSSFKRTHKSNEKKLFSNQISKKAIINETSKNPISIEIPKKSIINETSKNIKAPNKNKEETHQILNSNLENYRLDSNDGPKILNSTAPNVTKFIFPDSHNDSTNIPNNSKINENYNPKIIPENQQGSHENKHKSKCICTICTQMANCNDKKDIQKQVDAIWLSARAVIKVDKLVNAEILEPYTEQNHHQYLVYSYQWCESLLVLTQRGLFAFTKSSTQANKDIIVQVKNDFGHPKEKNVVSLTDNNASKTHRGLLDNHKLVQNYVLLIKFPSVNQQHLWYQELNRWILAIYSNYKFCFLQTPVNSIIRPPIYIKVDIPEINVSLRIPTAKSFIKGSGKTIIQIEKAHRKQVSEAYRSKYVTPAGLPLSPNPKRMSLTQKKNVIPKQSMNFRYSEIYYSQNNNKPRLDSNAFQIKPNEQNDTDIEQYLYISGADSSIRSSKSPSVGTQVTSFQRSTEAFSSSRATVWDVRDMALYTLLSIPKYAPIVKKWIESLKTDNLVIGMAWKENDVLEWVTPHGLYPNNRESLGGVPQTGSLENELVYTSNFMEKTHHLELRTFKTMDRYKINKKLVSEPRPVTGFVLSCLKPKKHNTTIGDLSDQESDESNPEDELCYWFVLNMYVSETNNYQNTTNDTQETLSSEQSDDSENDENVFTWLSYFYKRIKTISLESSYVISVPRSVFKGIDADGLPEINYQSYIGYYLQKENENYGKSNGKQDDSKFNVLYKESQFDQSERPILADRFQHDSIISHDNVRRCTFAILTPKKKMKIANSKLPSNSSISAVSCTDFRKFNVNNYFSDGLDKKVPKPKNSVNFNLTSHAGNINNTGTLGNTTKIKSGGGLNKPSFSSSLSKQLSRNSTQNMSLARTFTRSIFGKNVEEEVQASALNAYDLIQMLVSTTPFEVAKPLLLKLSLVSSDSKSWSDAYTRNFHKSIDFSNASKQYENNGKESKLVEQNQMEMDRKTDAKILKYSTTSKLSIFLDKNGQKINLIDSDNKPKQNFGEYTQTKKPETSLYNISGLKLGIDDSNNVPSISNIGDLVKEKLDSNSEKQGAQVHLNLGVNQIPSEQIRTLNNEKLLSIPIMCLESFSNKNRVYMHTKINEGVSQYESVYIAESQMDMNTWVAILNNHISNMVLDKVW
ncbi:hypothetical protein BB559_003607 [Furculomyces boomerangus]|uniref:PH domain-containing protein n=1 Tax=Furculomyces boomerangus TaxID=61424 RepID=A0A2T9YKD0_9FUNG|nr:hypothetical protein BB559_003607 [Furculomyces boomerangus]